MLFNGSICRLGVCEWCFTPTGTGELQYFKSGDAWLGLIGSTVNNKESKQKRGSGGRAPWWSSGDLSEADTLQELELWLKAPTEYVLPLLNLTEKLILKLDV